MGRYKSSGLGVGTNSYLQGNISQGDVDVKAEELARKEMIETLEKTGVKFTPNDVIFMAKDETGQLLWLEKGNSEVGLEHIKSRHGIDFETKHGVRALSLAEHLEEMVVNGKLEFSKIENINNRTRYQKLYSKNNQYYLLTGIGTNGFIVTAYPVKEDRARKLIRRYQKWKKK